jgi:hypothetical protein
VFMQTGCLNSGGWNHARYHVIARWYLISKSFLGLDLMSKPRGPLKRLSLTTST